MSWTPIVADISKAVSFLQEDKNKQALQLLAYDAKSFMVNILEQIQGDLPGQRFEGVSEVGCVATPPIASDMNVSPCNEFRFYRNAFTIKLLNENLEPRFIVHQLTGIIMYNMALAYHREGIQQGNLKLLRKALSVYRVALSSLLQCSSRGVGRFLMLAVSNNMGHIHALFFEYEVIDRYQAFLIFLMDDYNDNLAFGEIERDLLSVYKEHLFYTSFSACCAGAA